MNFLLDPKVYAGFVNNIGAAYVMPSAEKYIDKAIVNNPSLKYDAAVLEDDRVREVPGRSRDEAAQHGLDRGQERLDRVPSPVQRLDDERLFAYTPDPPVAARADRLGLQRMARLDANETHLGPFPGAIEAARRALGSANRYPEHGSALRERLASRHGVEPTSIVVGNGADALIGLLATAFLDPGDEAVMAVPSFVSYVQDTLRAGGRPVEVPVRPDGALDLPAMAERITARTRLVFVCNPNNPTGGALARDEVAAFVDAVPPSVLVVLDEAYAEYVERVDYAGGPQLAATRPNVVVLRTFSKLFGLAGLRIGYLVGPPRIAGAVGRLRHWFDVTDAAHLAALACLGDPGRGRATRCCDACRPGRARGDPRSARTAGAGVGGELRRESRARRRGVRRPARGARCARAGRTGPVTPARADRSRRRRRSRVARRRARRRRPQPSLSARCIATRCAGDVPQHPPIRFAPASRAAIA